MEVFALSHDWAAHLTLDWAAHLALPLFSWFDVGATAIVLTIAALLLGSMFMFIRIASDDSDRYKDLKEMVETLFGTPAHLRQHAEPSLNNESASSTGASAATTTAATTATTTAAPFSEPCPACSETVTERDAECPSCGLRLL